MQKADSLHFLSSQERLKILLYLRIVSNFVVRKWYKKANNKHPSTGVGRDISIESIF